MREYHVRFRERFRGETPLYLLDVCLDCLRPQRTGEANIAVTKMEEDPPQVTYRRDLQTALRCFSGD